MPLVDVNLMLFKDQAGCPLDHIVNSKSDGANSTHYLHKDHLGSIATITDENGLVIESQGYDAHGKRRNSDWSDIVGNPSPSGTTDRGFTGHEHVDEVGLIHMNGRVYDATLGRFISADPNIQEAYNSQNEIKGSASLIFIFISLPISAV